MDRMNDYCDDCGEDFDYCHCTVAEDIMISLYSHHDVWWWNNHGSEEMSHNASFFGAVTPECKDIPKLIRNKDNTYSLGDDQKHELPLTLIINPSDWSDSWIIPQS